MAYIMSIPMPYRNILVLATIILVALILERAMRYVIEDL